MVTDNIVNIVGDDKGVSIYLKVRLRYVCTLRFLGHDSSSGVWNRVSTRKYVAFTGRISLSHAMRPGLKSAIFGWQND